MDKDIKAIIFDLGQVLINLEYDKLINAFHQLGATDVLGIWESTDLQKSLNGFELGNLTVEVFCDHIRKHLKQDTPDKQIINAWNKMLGDIPDYKLDTILDLRDKYRVFLLSNTNRLHWDYSCENHFSYKGHNVDDFFEKSYTSFELHMMKPDKAIYQFVLDDIKIHPKEVLFIDDRKDNCLSAANIGMNIYQARPLEDWRFLFE